MRGYVVGALVAIHVFAFVAAKVLAQQQQGDPGFDAAVKEPAYSGGGPRVLFDEAHHNFHTSDGRYKPFADLMRNDGYRIASTKDRFTSDLLKNYDILVIANALGAERMGSREAADPAFSPKECDAVRDWVQQGGALLLITDHYPTGFAAKPLADRFSVQMSLGATEEYDFTAGQGLVSDHPIVKGRRPEEGVKHVRSFTGQSLQGPEGSIALLSLPPGARERLPDPVDPHAREPKETSPAKYPSQAVAFTFGKGRVVVLGEAAMMTAQISGGRKVGMNQPGIDNRQFALNVMHWLSGLLPER